MVARLEQVKHRKSPFCKKIDLKGNSKVGLLAKNMQTGKKVAV